MRITEQRFVLNQSALRNLRDRLASARIGVDLGSGATDTITSSLLPSRELAERYYNVTAWAEHPVRGTLPAVAEPELLAQILRDIFRAMRH